MSEANRFRTSTRVALAMAFISGVNANFQSVDAQNKLAHCSESVERPSPRVTDAESLSQRSEACAIKAYNLLRRAEGYLRFDDRAMVEQSFSLDDSAFRHRFRAMTEINDIWTHQLLTKNGITPWISDSNQVVPDSPAARITNAVLAIKSIDDAQRELTLVDAQHNQMNLYNIAVLLLKKAGDEKGAASCDAQLENLIKNCEQDKQANEKQIASAVAVLNAKAYAYLPVEIPSAKTNRPFSLNDFLRPSQKEFPAIALSKAEKLWLRSEIIADKLPESAHTRRMAHRNLALWYQAVGRDTDAEQQKQILFSLIGKRGDQFLYPNYTVCGHEIWWVERSRNETRINCGMG